MPPRVHDLTGRRFGHLVVVERASSAHQTTRWLCRCDCGAERTVYRQHLMRGRTRSCGCQTAALISAAVRASSTTPGR